MAISVFARPEVMFKFLCSHFSCSLRAWKRKLRYIYIAVVTPKFCPFHNTQNVKNNCHSAAILTQSSKFSSDSVKCTSPFSGRYSN